MKNMGYVVYYSAKEASKAASLRQARDIGNQPDSENGSEIQS